MPKPRWTKPEQRTWLEARVAEFTQAQQDRKTSVFLQETFQEWQKKWPIETPTDEEIGQAEGNLENASAIKCAAQVECIKNWFYNTKRSASYRAGSRDILQLNLTPKPAQASHRLQIKADESNPVQKNETFQMAIDNLPGTLQKTAEAIYQQTGWKTTIIVGGPYPRLGGRITALAVHQGSDDESETFETYLGGACFENEILSKFEGFLHQSFDQEERNSRTLDRTSKEIIPEPKEHSGAGQMLKPGEGNKQKWNKGTNRKPKSTNVEYEQMKAENIRRYTNILSGMSKGNDVSTSGSAETMDVSSDAINSIDTNNAGLDWPPWFKDVGASVSLKDTMDNSDDEPPNATSCNVLEAAMLSLANCDDDDVIDLQDATYKCPYCDTPFDFQPSPELLKIQTELEAITYPDPLPENPDHRSASSFTIYIEFCTLHRFEATRAGIAREKSWPEDINFSQLFTRICQLRPMLQAVLTDIADYKTKCDADSTFRVEDGNDFFAKAVKASSAGSGASYSAFEGHGAGYYGDEGYQILSVALTFLFPDGSLDLKRFEPVPWDSLIHVVLLPEAAVALIQDDLGLNRKDAIATMRESQAFGSALHPGDDSPHVEKLLRYTRRLMSAENTGYPLWIASGATLGLSEWANLQKKLGKDVNIKHEVEDAEGFNFDKFTRKDVWKESVCDDRIILELVDD